MGLLFFPERSQCTSTPRLRLREHFPVSKQVHEHPRGHQPWHQPLAYSTNFSNLALHAIDCVLLLHPRNQKISFNVDIRVDLRLSAFRFIVNLKKPLVNPILERLFSRIKSPSQLIINRKTFNSIRDTEFSECLRA